MYRCDSNTVCLSVPSSGARPSVRPSATGSFRGYPQKGVARCYLDSCTLPSSFFA